MVKSPTKTPEEIRRLFNYDPEMGELTRKIYYGRGIAGATFSGNRVMIDGQSYVIARVIWCHYYGEWPPDDILVDHKDRIHANNEITNLRLATYTENQLNKAGCGQYAKGVTWRNRIGKPWQAKIRVNGERLHLGSFATEEEAAEAYRQAATKYHGEFACHK